MLYMLVMYASPSGPICLRCLMLTLSGPVELLFWLYFIATWTCVVVSVMLVVCSLSVFISMCLFVLCVLCLTVLICFHTSIIRPLARLYVMVCILSFLSHSSYGISLAFSTISVALIWTLSDVYRIQS